MFFYYSNLFIYLIKIMNHLFIYLNPLITLSKLKTSANLLALKLVKILFLNAYTALVAVFLSLGVISVLICLAWSDFIGFQLQLFDHFSKV